MLHAAIGGAFEPDLGAGGDVELAVGIIGLAMATGLLVGARAVDGAVVLGHVEVEGPGAELADHLAVGGPELFRSVAFLEEGGFGFVVTHQVEVGVSEVGLEAEGLRHADAFEGVEHRLPRVHASPADFAFRGDAFAMAFGDLRGLLEGVDDAGRVSLRVLAPLLHAELGGVHADDAVLADAMLVEELGDAAGLLDREQELLLLFVGTHRGITHRATPDRSDERAHLQALGGDEVRHLLEVVLGDIGVGVRVEQEQVDAVELVAVDVGGDGHVEHLLESDRRVIGVGLLADEAGPHRVVQFHERRGGVRGRGW